MVMEHAPVRRDARRRVQHHTDRVPAGHLADRELWIIGDRSPGADHYRIHQGPQAVQMHDVRRSGDEV